MGGSPLDAILVFERGDASQFIRLVERAAVFA